MKPTIKEINKKGSERTFLIERESIDEESRTAWLSISSEEPYERWWGVEILDHSPKSIKTERLEKGAPLLVGHDTADQVGVVEKFEIAGKKLRILARFSKSARGEEIFQDVIDGIRKNASVGYMINDMVLEKSEGDVNYYRVTSWMPYEGSLVPIPADPNVGVGRNFDPNSGDTQMAEEVKAKEEVKEQKTEVNADEIAKRENTRVNSLLTVGDEFQTWGGVELARELIKDKTATIETFKQRMADKMRGSAKPSNTVDGKVEEARRIEMTYPVRSGSLKAFDKNNREHMERAYRGGMWVKAAIFGDKQAEQWCRDYGVRVMTGQTSGTSSVVPDELVTPIIDLREMYGVARRYCYVVPMGSDTATVPRRKSGVTAYFVGRSDATTASDKEFDDVNLVAREVAALTRLSNSYMADAVINLADDLANEMAYAFAVKEDDCLFNGDGSSTYGGIYGIRPKLIDGNHTVGAVDGASGIDTFAEVTATDLETVAGTLPYYAGINPSWFVSKRGKSLMFDRLAGAAGGNTKGDMAAQRVSQWMGDDIVIAQSMPSDTGDLSNVCMAVYGDLGMGVTFGDRMGIEVMVLRERYAEYRQTGIQCVERFDIAVHGLGDTSNAGPIVGLIGE